MSTTHINGSRGIRCLRYVTHANTYLTQEVRRNNYYHYYAISINPWLLPSTLPNFVSLSRMLSRTQWPTKGKKSDPYRSECGRQLSHNCSAMSRQPLLYRSLDLGLRSSTNMNHVQSQHSRPPHGRGSGPRSPGVSDSPYPALPSAHGELRKVGSS
jgi:hypothetical protein